MLSLYVTGPETAMLLILLDRSSSMAAPLMENEKPHGYVSRLDAARGCLLTKVGGLDQNIRIIAFNKSWRFVRIEDLYLLTPDGVPDVINALAVAFNIIELYKSSPSRILLITGGEDYTFPSRRYLTAGLRYLRSKRIPVDICFLGEKASTGTHYLDRLAKLTGGRCEAAISRRSLEEAVEHALAPMVHAGDKGEENQPEKKQPEDIDEAATKEREVQADQENNLYSNAIHVQKQFKKRPDFDIVDCSVFSRVWQL